MTSANIADHYFACIRERNLDRLVTHFTEDGIIVLPDGREISGVASIRAMYTALFAAQAPFPTPTVVIVGANGVATEIEVRLPDGSIRNTANFFHLDDKGLVKRMSVYGRNL